MSRVLFSLTWLLSLIVLPCWAAAVEAPGAPGAPPTQYVRFQHGDTTAYGLVEGDHVRQLDGDLFGDFQPTAQSYPMSQVKLLPPTQPTQVLALAGNYRSHLGEDTIPPKFQIVQPFFKSPSCLIGQGDAIVLPRDSVDVHFEAELVFSKVLVRSAVQ